VEYKTTSNTNGRAKEEAVSVDVVLVGAFHSVGDPHRQLFLFKHDILFMVQMSAKDKII
jgi:hypothetical protein